MRSSCEYIRGDHSPRLLFGRGYYVELNQFSRILLLLGADSRRSYPSNQLAEDLGLTPAKTRGLTTLARGFDLINRSSILLTPIGRAIAISDTFFDDIGTLWFMHYTVSSEPRILVWNRLANRVVPSKEEFTLTQFRVHLDDTRNGHAEYSGEYHVKRESLTVLRAYTEERFSRLGYLRVCDGLYGLGYREPVPPLVLAASIARFRDQHRPGATALTIMELLESENGPGRVFQLGEDRLRAGLEALKAEPGIALESRADLDQIRLTDDTPDHLWMERYYASR